MAEERQDRIEVSSFAMVCANVIDRASGFASFRGLSRIFCFLGVFSGVFLSVMR